jgi:hypothetical protein
MVVSLDIGLTTKLVLQMQPVTIAKSYELQTRNGGGWTREGRKDLTILN